MEENKKVDVKSSILNSVKKQLGLLPELKEFDSDIIMNINAAILTLKQIGVGPQDFPFTVEDESQTYDDYLGLNSPETPYVKMYLFYKTKVSFDPPQNSIVMNAYEKNIAEIESRLSYQVDSRATFEQGGEIS